MRRLSICRGSSRRMKEVCIRGHAMTAENVYWHKRSQNWRCKSCNRERMRAVYRKNAGENYGKGNATHGCARTEKKTPEYRVWNCMKARCYNPKNVSYKYYGGRGISVCDRWKESFENFLLDVGLRPIGKYTIDRIDGAKNYQPGNCKWSTAKEQANNRRRPMPRQARAVL